MPGVTRTASLATERPAKVIAWIVKLYVFPFTSPLIMVDVNTFTFIIFTTPRSVYVILYPVIGRPPVFVGATQLSAALATALVPTND